MSHDDPTISSDDRSSRQGPTRIGRFTLRRIIASGGMGTVYEAIQDHPRRPVAIKVMKKGVTSASALRRFEFESQLLARLRHPGVAEVYEAGTHDDGSGPVPYFAMEYVPNACSITAFADARNLDVRERLELFTQICDAVQHGHQKGIVHRDLKPDNIIVGSEGQPKIIDFGVARATDSDLAFATLQTHVGQLVGTLQYMSPEQVEADPHDIDIRSDVYSLGVILYELLAGRLPYGVSDITTLEAVRRIREDAPNRLGSAVRQLSGDVETIVHKALEKDRERRYQSAGEFAADIRRNLNRQPITARPPTLVYTLKVFTRRNRALVTSLAAVFAVLLIGAVTSTTLYFRAEAQRVEAERQAERAMNAVGFVNEMVKSASPSCVGEEVLVSDLLDSYGEQVGESFPDDPEIEAKVRTSLGESYRFLSAFEKGEQAASYKRAARSHFEAALELLQDVHGLEHPEVLAAMLTYASLLQNQGEDREAEQVCRNVLEVRTRELGEKDPDTIMALESIATILESQGRFEEAEQTIRKVLEMRRETLGEEDAETIAAEVLLAEIFYARGDVEAAEDLAKEVHATSLRLLGEDRWHTRSLRTLLSRIYLAQGRIEDARSLHGNRRIPETIGLEYWLQGQSSPAAGPVTMTVALESWCPYSANVMPMLQELHETYGDRGLEVIGITQISMNSTEEKIRKFIKQYDVTFPFAKVTDDAPDVLYPGSVPYAVLAQGKTIVWRGHPQSIPPNVFEDLLAAN